MNDQLDDMIRDIGPESFQRAQMYDNLRKDKEDTLYPGCTNFTRLSAVLRLFNLKARNGWTDKSFTELLELLKEMLPEGNTLPNSNYEAKKILCPMGMEYKKIHACPNDCILYRNEFEELKRCPRCGLSRYKVKDNDFNCDGSIQHPPAKVLWYLPIIPRLKRLFNNVNDAKNIRWHADERKCDGYVRHPADSIQWKKIDALYPEFGNEPRNLRLGLATDGMNPFGNLSTNHSSWPVLLIIYNLPPSICMKRKYIMLSMMISGPKQPGNDIDVYLSPLIEDLRMLWEEGVHVFDAHSRDYFTLRAMLFCTINDFPAYGNLSGYSVKGHKACPICEKRTRFQQLRNGKKTVYLRHRRFLKRNHPYRRLKTAFNGSSENEIASQALTGEQVYDKVKDVNVIFGKGQKQTAVKKKWKKRSVFFNLPYWSSLDVRHCIDVMHVEKNVCDSVIGTLLNIPGKTKDTKNARLDMVELGIREQLAPQSTGKRTYLPPACHTLSKKERKSFCDCLQGIKVPQGYSSNFKRLVSVKDLKLVGLKSHDCHILMQQLLPVAIRDILPKKVRDVLTRLSLFFNAICSKVIDPNKLDELENEAAIILCQLEMYFPPAFFDIMVHLIVHLVREIRLCGPVYLRWMYPVERYMKILKGYVKNLRHPEASIVERYVAEEAIEFVTDYMSEAKTIGIPKSRHEGRYAGKGRQGLKLKSKGRAEVLQAQLYILNNTDEVMPYLSAHKAIVKGKNSRVSEKWLMKEHNKTFLKWFKETILNDNSASDTLIWLSREPNFDVITWSGYDINNFAFSTKTQDDKSTVQNSGVMVVAESMHFSSSKDKNPVIASIPYFGIIEEIWEVDFMKFKVPVFKCKWIEINSGVTTDEFGFTLVDLEKAAYTDEPFIMASQAKQVFYVSDPSNEKWSVVLQGKNMHEPNESLDSTLDISESPFSQRIPTSIEETIADDVYATRHDHEEGIWEKA
ncbi:hypothetical protein L195_g026293 [Trifolium pratense]|uniref:Transposase n=1 Tax=Trifolium pratense TaxID=57577 RepID=A0A2K3NIW5_TRIPR|nr:hypothetical protein L195_g026293 [Trifolium pratense]